VRARASVAAVLLTQRNCEAAVGLAWDEVRALAEQKNVPIERVGRRSFVRVSDFLEALDGARSRPWTDDDTAVEIEAARGGR
jgi:hypothetical protein